MKAAVLDDLGWKDDALAAIEAQAKKGRRFDAYTLTQAGLRPPPHSNMWGPMFRWAAALEIIEKTGAHSSQRRTRSGGSCYTWVGTPAFRAQNTHQQTA